MGHRQDLFMGRLFMGRLFRGRLFMGWDVVCGCGGAMLCMLMVSWIQWGKMGEVLTLGANLDNNN